MAACLGACGSPEPPSEDPAPDPAGDVTVARHVVLVTLDTLRADHVGAYGGDVDTPHLDRLADEGALALQAAAHVPLTRPSHVALFSGLLPLETGIRDNVSPVEIPAVPLLAEVLSANGFKTAAFVSAAVVSADSGLDRGFTVYGDELGEGGRFLSTAQRRGDATLAQALDWLEANASTGSRLFLWLHLYDPHEPYEAPEPWGSRYPGRPYAGEVAWADDLVGRLDEALQRLGLASETLLAVTSDHGEGLGDHDELLHGFFVYESTLRVPLIVRGPGVVAGARIGEVVGLVDLYPTLLEMAGVERPAVPISGRSFAAALRGGGEAGLGTFYAESLIPRLRFGWSELRVVRDGSFKYIDAPRPELYDLAEDPGETTNLLAPGAGGETRRKARELRAALDTLRIRELDASVEQGAEMSAEMREKLQALGYLGGSDAASTATPGADPKDKIAEFRLANALMRDGLELLQEERFEAAETKFRELRERDIDSAEIRLYLGQALLGRGRGQADRGVFQEAAEHLIEATKRSPGLPEAWLGAAEARQLAGDLPAALETLRDAQAFLPRHIPLRREEARLLRMAGRPGEARAALEGALETSPENAFLHAALSEVQRELGDLEGSLASLRKAVELEPRVAAYWNTLGMTLGGVGELAEAERAFREAWRLDASNPRTAFNLGLALVRQDRPGEARPFFEACLELEPRFEPAREQLRALGG